MILALAPRLGLVEPGLSCWRTDSDPVQLSPPCGSRGVGEGGMGSGSVSPTFLVGGQVTEAWLPES